MRLNNPAPGRPITSPYGMRKHPFSGAWKKHHGIDYGGTFKVLCAGDGIVNYISWSPRGGGHVVIIKHATNLYTVYYHGRERTQLKKGQRVRAGDVVYTSGSTGASTGPHLHFEARVSRVWGTTRDPQLYIDGSATVAPQPIRVTGRLDRATWKAWQETLKEDWGYEGIIDGIPGKLSWSAVQRSVVQYGYRGPIDGTPGPFTRTAVQRRLADKGFYTGKIDGIWGRGTIGALQNALNKNEY
jgi:peptidoglycan hydrolase-like protein with peptidoglycan-binding domain